MAGAGNPDAILYRAQHKVGSSSIRRATHVQQTFGPLLGGSAHTSLGPAHGGRVYSRSVGGGWWMASLAHDDTLLFATDHDHARMPRYRWEDQPDGTRHGWLLSPLEVEQAAMNEAPAETRARQAALDELKRRSEANCARLARWRELVPLGDRRTPEQEQEMRDLQVELFGPEREPAGS